MATFTFYGTSYRVYNASGATVTDSFIRQGTSANNYRSIVLFDSATIRSTLANYAVTSCQLRFQVSDQDGPSSAVFLGTHNYTALPATWDNSNRLAAQRVKYQADTGLHYADLGATIGSEFRNGVSTGITVGPVPSGYDRDWERVSIQPTGAATNLRPMLIIEATSANQPPNPPVNLSPANNAVANIANTGLTFSWTHNDPNGDAQVAYYFRRNRGGGTYDYWNGSAFVSTQARIASASQSVTIPAGQWANGTAYSWSVRTEDTGNLVGNWSGENILYASTPPTAVSTAPSGNVTTARPTLSWTYSDPEGQAQYGWIVQVVPSEVYNASGYNPDNYTSPAFSTSGVGSTSSITTTTDLVNHKTYRSYVKVSSSPLPASALQFSSWSFSTFTVLVPPFAPSMVYPQNGSIADLAAGFTMDWNNTFYGPGSQTAFTIRRITAGGSYQWWNGLNWSSTTEVWLSGTQSQYAFRPNEISNGVTYTFSVAIRDDYSQVSPYSSGATVTGSAQAQVTIISPQSTAITTRPLVQWSEYDPENDPQQTYQVRIIAESVYSGQGAGWNPGTATAVWDSTEIIDNSGFVRNVVVGTDLVNGSNYRAYVRVKTGGVYSGWTYSEFQVSLIGPATPQISTEIDQDSGTIEIVVQGRDSFFDVATAGNFSGWSADGNCTVQNQVFFSSSRSSRISTMTATATGGMDAVSAAKYPVYPGQVYTAAATVSMATGTAGGGQPAYLALAFYDSGNQLLSRAAGNTIVDDSAQRTSVTAAAPEGATQAAIQIHVGGSPPVGAVHAFFDPVFRPGTGSEWSPGGLVGLTKISVQEKEGDRPLRRAQNIVVPTTTQLITVRDEEAQIGRSQTYEATTSTVYSGGAVLTSVPAPANPTLWTSGWLWLSDPLRLGTARAFGPQSLGDIIRPVRQGKFRPLGRADAVVTTGTRGLREGSFKLVTWTREEREAFQDLVDTSGILLLRIPPDQGDVRGDTLYIRIQGDAPEVRPLPSRTPHRTIEQAWVEQNWPVDLLDWSEANDEGI